MSDTSPVPVFNPAIADDSFEDLGTTPTTEEDNTPEQIEDSE